LNLVKKFLYTVQKPSKLFTDQLFMQSPVPSCVIDEDQTIVMVNSAFNTLSGYIGREVIGMKISVFKSGRHEHLFYEERWGKLMAAGFYEGEVWSRCYDQSEKLLLEKIQRIEHDSRTYYMCMLEDVTESRKLVERYRYLAMHDALTGLANRSLAKDRFSHALVNTVRAGEKLGVLLCDLNEFKQVNDTYGHHIGDLLLIEIGKKLVNLVREGDTVARIGGDEFLIIVERLKSEDELDLLIQKIQKEMQTSFNLDGQIIDSRVSIGDACSPRDGLTYENLLKVADHKMYNEKERYYGYV